MRVIIDGSLYYEAPSGGGYNYLNELIPRLAGFSDLKLTVNVPRQATMPSQVQALPEIRKEVLPRAPWFPQGRMKRLLGSCRRWGENQLWYARFFPIQSALYHSTYYSLPPVRGLKTIVTIHDMISELFPEEMSQNFHDVLRERKKACFQRANHFIAISQRTKDDFCRLTSISPEKVSVIYHGIRHELFSREDTPAEIESTRKRYGIPGPYLLYVGGRHLHKNFARFAEAYASSGLRKDYYLLAVGFAWEQEEKALLSRLGILDRVRLAVSPAQVDLGRFYRMADFFVYPSVYEGFGMPLLEAMASGTPIATSRSSSMSEVAGDAAELFDPLDVADIRRGIETLTDRKRSTELRQAGFRRVKDFSWEKTAELTRDAYRRALG